MADLIDRKALIEKLDRAGVLPEYAKFLIEQEPTISPVHAAGTCYCRECKYKEKAKVNVKGFLICPASGMEITDDDFCSYGEPREDKP